MWEWWTYRLEDLLLFSPRVYWRMFDLHNRAVWPLHVPAFLSGLAIILLWVRCPRRHGLWITFLLAAIWTFVGWSFLWSRYGQINWAMAYLAPGFWLQAVLLIVLGASGRITFDHTGSLRWPGLALATLALFVYPLLCRLASRPWTTTEVFGVAPDPTAIATLGLLIGTGCAPAALLSVIPLLWLLVSGFTLHTLGEPQALAPFAAIASALLLIGLNCVPKKA